MMSEATITLDSREEAILLFGSRDLHLKDIRTALGVQQLVGRGDQIIIKGTDDQISLAQRVFGQLRQMLRDQGSLSDEDVKTVIEVVAHGGERIGPQNEKPLEAVSR
jgi:phosphate starvation-inducible protein PhoH and related proteins